MLQLLWDLVDRVLDLSDPSHYVGRFEGILDGAEGPDLVHADRARADKPSDSIVDVVLALVFVVEAYLVLQNSFLLFSS